MMSNANSMQHNKPIRVEDFTLDHLVFRLSRMLMYCLLCFLVGMTLLNGFLIASGQHQPVDDDGLKQVSVLGNRILNTSLLAMPILIGVLLVFTLVASWGRSNPRFRCLHLIGFIVPMIGCCADPVFILGNESRAFDTTNIDQRRLIVGAQHRDWDPDAGSIYGVVLCNCDLFGIDCYCNDLDARLYYTSHEERPENPRFVRESDCLEIQTGGTILEIFCLEPRDETSLASCHRFGTTRRTSEQ